MTQYLALLKQETGQGFVLVTASLFFFYKQGAPDFLLYTVAALGAVYIVGEKLRATFKR